MQIDLFPDLEATRVSPLRSAGAAGADAGAPPRWASLMAHWRAWLPILMRVTATGLALLGLAGIGLAARGSSELPALARAPLAVGFAQMLGPAPLAPGTAPARPVAAPDRVASGTVASGTVAPQQCSCDEPLPCAPSPVSVPPHAQASAAAAAADVGRGVTADGRVILNQAGALELQRLPGIGAKRAAAILELRRRVGRFRRTSELLRVKGIGRRTLEHMAASIVLDGPGAVGAPSTATAP